MQESRRSSSKGPGLVSYKASGVDISAGEESVERIKGVVASTYRSEVLGSLGGFGALFDAGFTNYRSPVLVSSTDGVGTKSQLARATKRFDSIGFDLVAMCVDDLACLGAEPLFFLDYLAVGKLTPKVASSIVGGIATACREVGCSLIGGEMAEHPGVMEEGDFDLAGFAVGVVEKEDIWSPTRVTPGDVLVALESPNLRCNGFSLIRKIFAKEIHSYATHGEQSSTLRRPGSDKPLVEELLEPSVLYAKAIASLRGRADIRAAAHITGGGLISNLSRAIPKGCVARVSKDSWSVPSIFRYVADIGGVHEMEMYATFNMGVGMVMVVDPSSVEEVRQIVMTSGLESYVIGDIVLATNENEHGSALWKEE